MRSGFLGAPGNHAQEAVGCDLREDRRDFFRALIEDAWVMNKRPGDTPSIGSAGLFQRGQFSTKNLLSIVNERNVNQGVPYESLPSVHGCV